MLFITWLPKVQNFGNCYEDLTQSNFGNLLMLLRSVLVAGGLARRVLGGVLALGRFQLLHVANSAHHVPHVAVVRVVVVVGERLGAASCLDDALLTVLDELENLVVHILVLGGGPPC